MLRRRKQQAALDHLIGPRFHQFDSEDLISSGKHARPVRVVMEHARRARTPLLDVDGSRHFVAKIVAHAPSKVSSVIHGDLDGRDRDGSPVGRP
jgi:hypothetical protein